MPSTSAQNPEQLGHAQNGQWQQRSLSKWPWEQMQEGTNRTRDQFVSPWETPLWNKNWRTWGGGC